MKKLNAHLLSTSIALLVAGSSQGLLAETSGASSLEEALTSGKVNVDLRLRYENVDQDNALDDADALTLRTLLGYTTGTYQGFSAKVEMEDVRTVLGVDDYSVPQSGVKPGQYSVIADPETTELDQAYLQYQNGVLTAKLGRQVITYDNHRFIAHVGWRQDRQTFDAFTLNLKPSENITLSYNYIDERERIFAEDQDIDSDDHLFNAALKTPVGTLTGYAYLLEDEDTDQEIDTYGVRFDGSAQAGDIKLLYTAEYASQEFDQGAADFDADYYNLVGGIEVKGFSVKVGYEVLGSDDSAYGFATPLATLHAHNGWADQFLSTPMQGLVDTSISVGGKLAGGSFQIVYHDFEADDDTPTVDDLGDEIDLVYSRKFGKHYSAGVKYAAFSADDVGVDADKLWVWFGVTF